MSLHRATRALSCGVGLVLGASTITLDSSAQTATPSFSTSVPRSPTGRAIALLGAPAAEMMAAKTPGALVQALVTLPLGVDPTVLGLRSILPGIAVLSGDAARIAGFVRAHPDCSIEVAPPLRPKLDVAVPYVAAERARLDGLPGALDGSGVYIGIVDTGLDLTHPDFLGKDGLTRVAWLLDFSVAPRAGNARDQSYGARVYDHAELLTLLAASPRSASLPDDPDGHGTHVAGIATGNGGEAKKFVGVAPGAELIIVRATRDESGSIDEADAVTGTRFVFDMAQADGKPAVANLSLGSQFGPHDGTSTFERSLALLATGPGRAVVVAASNEGSTPIHTSLRVTPHAKFEIPIRMDGIDGKGLPYQAAQVFLWLNFRDAGDLKVSIHAPDGEKWLDDVGAGGGYQVEPDGLVVQVVNDVIDGTVIPHGTHGAIVTMRGPLPIGEYTLVLEGDGAVEAWLQGVGDASDGPGAAYFPRGGQIEGTIGVPASSDGLISVGCVGVRTSYRYGPLKEFATTGVAPGTRCYYSSAGPSAVGALRPDILAPGYFVISALAHRAREKSPAGDFPTESIVDATHAALSGTSMSTPFVTGATAILFEQDPKLTQEDVRAALQAGARALTDDAIDPILRRDYGKGAGILDVEGALSALARKADPPMATQMQLRLGASYLDNDGIEPLSALVIMRDASGRPADLDPPLQLTLEGARLVAPIAQVSTGLFRFAIVPIPDASGATIHLSGGGLTLSREVAIGADRWDARFGLGAGGGCSCVTIATSASRQTDDARSILSIALVALIVIRLRRRRADSRAAAFPDRRGTTETWGLRC